MLLAGSLQQLWAVWGTPVSHHPLTKSNDRMSEDAGCCKGNRAGKGGGRECEGGGGRRLLTKCSGKPPQTVTFQQDLRGERESERERGGGPTCPGLRGDLQKNRHSSGTLQRKLTGSIGRGCWDGSSFKWLWRVFPSLRHESVYSARAPAPLKSFVVVVICRLEMTTGKMQCNWVPWAQQEY